MSFDSILRKCRTAAHGLLATVLAGLASAAVALPLPFLGDGLIAVTGNNGQPPPALELNLAVLNTSYTVGGDAGWTLTILNWTYNPVTMIGGGGFLFAGPQGTISGTGEQLALALELDDPTGPFFGVPLTLAHRYTATGGTGLYAGFAGVADSLVERVRGTPAFTEQGVFVPEPGVGLLLLAGALAATATTRRRV